MRGTRVICLCTHARVFRSDASCFVRTHGLSELEINSFRVSQANERFVADKLTSIVANERTCFSRCRNATQVVQRRVTLSLGHTRACGAVTVRVVFMQRFELLHNGRRVLNGLFYPCLE